MRPARGFWELKRPYDDGTTHLAFEPLVFLERLAALVPPPRVHLEHLVAAAMGRLDVATVGEGDAAVTGAGLLGAGRHLARATATGEEQERGEPGKRSSSE